MVGEIAEFFNALTERQTKQEAAHQEKLRLINENRLSKFDAVNKWYKPFESQITEKVDRLEKEIEMFQSGQIGEKWLKPIEKKLTNQL